MRFAALIFDFDGVLIESEYEGNRHLAELLTELGHPIDTQTSMDRFMGLAGNDFHAAIEQWIGGPIPGRFHELREAENARVLAEGVPSIDGALDFLASLPAALPIAIASSSSSQWIMSHLGHHGLAGRFAGRVFSGREHVTRGKPAPDIYLHAAAALGVPIADTLILEDSPVGVRGAVASGATVVGLCAGRHCGADHAARLTELGAQHVARDYADVAALIA